MYRLLHRSAEATADFKQAFELLDKNDKVGDCCCCCWMMMMIIMMMMMMMIQR